MNKKSSAAFFALLAAALYALNVPFSKFLISDVSPAMLAAFLYLGAGLGMGLLLGTKRIFGVRISAPLLTRRDLPYTALMVVLDIAAPIFLMLGIERANAANVSLLNNLEIVATALIALIIFKERISPRLWFAISLVLVSGVLLSFDGGAFEFNTGSLFVIAASAFWGLENNCTRRLSEKSSEEIVLIKGIFSGLGALGVALIAGEKTPTLIYILLVMLLGFVAYGLSINFYIMAQKHIGAAKTSAFYSVAPFLGVAFSFAVLGERPSFQFYIGLAFMVIATVILVLDTAVQEKS